jgi:hypothetical protein
MRLLTSNARLAQLGLARYRLEGQTRPAIRVLLVERTYQIYHESAMYTRVSLGTLYHWKLSSRFHTKHMSSFWVNLATNEVGAVPSPVHARTLIEYIRLISDMARLFWRTNDSQNSLRRPRIIHRLLKLVHCMYLESTMLP